jgi:large subunit ribosomal protein L19
MRRVAQIEKGYIRDDHPQFTPGDTVKVHVRIKEGEKERIQVFQGAVISRRGRGTGATFIVRKVSGGIGVERVFSLHSPNIAKIERVRSGQVRRGKLYYLRNLTGKSARIKEVITTGTDKEKNKTAK